MRSRNRESLRIAAAMGIAAALLAEPAAAQPARPQGGPKAGAPAAAAPKPGPAGQAAPRTAPSALAPAAQAPPSKPLSETLTGAAKAEYEGGKILFQAKDFAAALVKFEHAYEISKDPRLLWNAAICQKELRRYTRMLATIDRLLKEGGPLLTEQDRTDAAEIVKTVKEFVSPLKLTVNEPGAQVLVDGEVVGTTPLTETVLVDVGSRKIRVTKPGYKDVERAVTVVGASDVAIDVKLRKEVHRGRLVVTAGPKDLIAIDGKVVGQGRFEGSLPSGGHTLRVTAPGMAMYQSEVVLKDEQTRSVPVSLNPLPSSSDASKWLWVAGGAALLTGAIVGSVFLFQPNEGVPGTLRAAPVELSFGGGR
jgi:hypothetical protein